MNRDLESSLRFLLGYFPCVVLLGSRQCGKTTLMRSALSNWKHFDLEKSSDMALVAKDPDLFLRLNPQQVTIDEAQLLPALFSALRVAIDEDRSVKGRYVLTGSSSPELMRNIHESLAGRAAVIELSPFSLSEVMARPQHWFGDWITGSQNPQDLPASPDIADIETLHRHWLLGGYPEPWLESFKAAEFHGLWMEQFGRTYVERDLSRLFPHLDITRFLRFVQHLAGYSSQTLNLSELARALDVSQPTIKDYLHIAHGTYLWRQVPAFARQASKRLVKHPRGHLRDSGLLHHYLGIRSLDQLLTHPMMGHSWESYGIEAVMRSLAATAKGHQISYYRTSAGAEVDLVIEQDNRLLPIEIKYTQTLTGKHLVNLKRFMQEFQCPTGIVLCNCERLDQIDEGIWSIPVGAI